MAQVRKAQTRIGHNASEEGASPTAAASVNVTALNSTFAKVGVNGRAIIDPGAYDVDGALVLNGIEDACIEGWGSRLTQTEDNTLCVNMTDCTNVTVIGFGIDGKGSDWTGTSGQSSTGVRMAGCVGCKVLHCNINNCAFASVLLTECSDCEIAWNTLKGPGKTVITAEGNYSFGVYLYLAGTNANNRIIGNTISDHAHGVQGSSGWANLKILHNTFRDIWGQHGIYLGGVRGVDISHNHFSNMELDAIKLQLTSGSDSDAGFNRICDNTVTGGVVYLSDAAITAAGTTLTSAAAEFAASDIGKRIYINGAGAGGVALVTTITAVGSGTSVTVETAASTTVSDAAARYGMGASWGINVSRVSGSVTYDGLEVRGNLVFDWFGGGATVRDCLNARIEGNEFKRVGNYGLFTSNTTGWVERNRFIETNWSSLYLNVPSGGRLEVRRNSIVSPVMATTITVVGGGTEYAIYVAGSAGGTVVFNDNDLDQGIGNALTYALRHTTSSIEMRRNRFAGTLTVRIGTIANLTVDDSNEVLWSAVHNTDGVLREGHGARQYTGTAAPTTGTWVEATIVWNGSPAPSGTVGWICTAGGTPGTWLAFGTIAA